MARNRLLLLAGAIAAAVIVIDPINAICQWCLGNDVTVAVVAALYMVRLLTEEGG